MRFANYLATIATMTTLVGVASVPAHGASFDTTGISFDEDTSVTFEFLESHGWFSSDFGVVEVDSLGDIIVGTETVLITEEARGFDLDEEGNNIDDFLGTAGETVLNPVTNFLFEAGKTYSLFLDSFGSAPDARGNRRPGSPVYSTTALNTEFDGLPGFDIQAEFSGDIFGIGSIVGWDDRGSNNDRDFNDFFVKATLDDVNTIPEPTTLMGLGLVAGVITLTRRQKGQNSQK